MQLPVRTFHASNQGSRNVANITACSSVISHEATVPQTLHQSKTEISHLTHDATKAPRPIPQFSWRNRVFDLFAPALTDAEDMMLSLPYTAIREKTGFLAAILDEIAPAALLSDTNTPWSRPRMTVRGGEHRMTLPLTCAAPESDERRQDTESFPANHFSTPNSSTSYSDVVRITKTIHACYQSLTAILVSCTSSLGHETEMQARRSLTTALAEMDKIHR